MTCSNCKKKGHLKKDCYFKDQKQTSPTCFKCKKDGHIAKDCQVKVVNIAFNQTKNEQDQTEENYVKVIKANPYQW